MLKQLLLLLAFAACALAQTHSATLAWVDTANPAGTTYNVWRMTGACPSPGPNSTPPSGFVQLNTSPITAKSYIDTTVAAGTTYCYVGTAVAAAPCTSNCQSAPSNTALGSVPASFPPQMFSVTVPN